MTRVEIPAYTDRWMMGDRYGEIVRTFRRGDVEYVEVRLDKSQKRAIALLSDCTPVD